MMFDQFLNATPMSAVLRRCPGCIYPAIEDRAAWEMVDPADREDLLQAARIYHDQPYPMLLATQYMAFVRDGSRSAFEAPYFFRRRKLIAAALQCCLMGQTAMLDDVIDGLWCICEESSWVISAHNVNSIPGARPARETPLPDPERINVDLFAAQTAMVLSYVTALLAGPLDAAAPHLRRRVEEEIERRVLGPFHAHDDFWWMGFVRRDLNNWTPWIVSNVMMTACNLVQDRLRLCRLLERGCRMLDRWLDCVPEDGGCDEGAAYWNMAGGALLDCLTLLETITGGQMTFWHVPKIRNILTYPEKARLGGGWFVNFADCDARPALQGERLITAGMRLQNPAMISLGKEMLGKASDCIADTPHLSRLLMHLFRKKAPRVDGQTQPKDVWLPDLQLRIREVDGFTLCVKGGHNSESHNHNDVGSFMLYVDGRPLIVDAGNMVYTAKTFSDERYTLWNTRAAYHNLPLIGGREQQPGIEHRAWSVKSMEYGLRLDMASAYDASAGVISAVRTASVRYGSLMLEDLIELEREAPVTWVFMLRNRPISDGEGNFHIGEGVLLHADRAQCRIEEIPVTDSRMARNFPGSLWRLSLTDAPAKSHHGFFLAERLETKERYDA